MAKPPFGGHGTFTRFTPRRRAATEYELLFAGNGVALARAFTLIDGRPCTPGNGNVSSLSSGY